MRTEPVRIISFIIAAALLALPHLAAFGVPITQPQLDALNTFLPSLLVLIGGEVARSRVSPVSKP